MSSRNLGDDGAGEREEAAGGAFDDRRPLRMWRPGERTRAGGWARFCEALEAERAHWFYWVPVGLGAGIAAYFALQFEPPLIFGLLTLLGVLGLRYALPERLQVRVLSDILVLLVAGFCLIALRTWWVDAPILSERIGPVEVRGFIELIEPREGPGDRLTLRVTKLGGLAQGAIPERVRIRTMAGDGKLSPGDAIVVKAKLAPPGGPALPGGFDFGRYAYFAGIGAVGFATAAPVLDETASEPPLALKISAAVQGLRRAIGQRVDRVLSGETAAIAKALLTGERGGIPQATNDAYRDSGIFHILSISGLHMAIMGGAVFWSVRFLLALFPSLALRYPVKKWAALAAAAGSLAYLAISGGSFATLRAFIMISIMFLAILLDRPAIALRNVALSALIILILFPESLLDVGFQMSFAAVVALVAAYEAVRVRFGQARPELPRWIGVLGVFVGGIILSTVIASVAVTPFAIFHFHKTQHYAVLANLLAVPICNIVVMPAALATLVVLPVGLEAGPLFVMGWGIEAMSATARFVAGLPGAVGMLPDISTRAFGLMLAGGLWLALWQHRWRFGGLALVCAGIATAPFVAHPDALVGRDGKLVAVRNSAGQFAALAVPHARFELKRWLEHDGDARDIAQVVAAPGLTCDGVGCLADIRGLRVAVSRHAASMADDCVLAGLLILARPAPKGCTGPRSVIDFFDVRTKGTHAVYVESPQRVRIETVADVRGVRPWAPRSRWSGSSWSGAGRRYEPRHATALRATPVSAQRTRQAGEPYAGLRRHDVTSAEGVSRFAAPLDLLDAPRSPRPEIEDELADDPD
ncbi:MAG TPA: ComEC/Rec2 family competence protein [Hyphomicrobiaceae bacterium]|nr:ComEC/Rec2 family competence protein [Hyphomicrobiaceae bacterium]